VGRRLARVPRVLAEGARRSGAGHDDQGASPRGRSLMPDIGDEQQGTPVVRSMAQVGIQAMFVETEENWQVQGTAESEAVPRPVRILISNQQKVSCHFLSIGDTATVVAQLAEVRRLARTSINTAAQLPTPTDIRYRIRRRL